MKNTHQQKLEELEQVKTKSDSSFAAHREKICKPLISRDIFSDYERRHVVDKKHKTVEEVTRKLADRSPEQLSEIFEHIVQKYEAPTLPTKAPVLYKERADGKQKPEDFLADVYGDFIGTPEKPARIFRSHIKAWDIRLYEALNKRRKFIENFETLLPPSRGRSAENLSRSESDHLAAHRRAAREGMARLRSDKRSIR